MSLTFNRSIVAFSRTKNEDVERLVPIQLACPRTGKPTLYLHDVERGVLYELQKVVGPGRKACWLMDNQLHKDGSIQFISPIDPLFIALPILHRAREHSEGKFRTIDDMFGCEQDMQHQKLLDLAGFEAQLAHICDIRDVSPELRAYRVNDDKVLVWLMKKMERLLPAIPSLITDDIKEDQKQDVYRQEAVYLLAKYIPESQLKTLLQHLGIEEIKEETADITSYFVDNTASYFKASPSMPKAHDDGNTPKKPETPRSLAKVNTRGMKPLTSFFKKK
ncbi:hypothetical protein RO3G_02482 [Lichtheimia corymbifera JMRC:FSU:9682]|uniref:Ribonuclease H2 subunit B n=1 Tax=Lichtheimia corymbifera JMRC:FSU:9682 TaxID=1263082 RepID=A0A068SDR0_9FUNG|nr:hypothetical protein RO3G_02482 [Lichtheimia corymbifera JMRC:FSU:9682]